MLTKNKSGFTLMELLVVISIISLLATLAVTSLKNAQSKSRDAKRKADLKQMMTATELYYDDNNSYFPSDGWLGDPGSVNTYLVGGNYMNSLLSDPLAPAAGRWYMHWRKDARTVACFTEGTAEQFSFYARLENPTADDLATMVDSFDQCVQSTWSAYVNFRLGN